MATTVKIVNSEVVANRVGLSVSFYIIHTLENGRYIMSELPEAREINEHEYQNWTKNAN